MQIKRCPTEKCYTNFVGLFRLQSCLGFIKVTNGHSLGMLYASFDNGVGRSLGYLDLSFIIFYTTFDKSFKSFYSDFLSYMLINRSLECFHSDLSMPFGYN